MPITPVDAAFLQHALDLAQAAVGLSEPNPRVGCVLTAADGRVIGEGHTQQAGGPHAEVMALRDAEARGESTIGATAHVTLEPCAHHGRTPPCADALVRAGVARVTIALGDPNPLVGGQGVARLRSAGIVVDVLAPDHPVAQGARELNIGFLSRMVRQRPWVRLKVATSLDGRTALHNGQSQWITGEAARADGHRWRARAGAVLTGVGTVLADDPRLDVRAIPVARQPVRVVLDSRWRTPPGARLLVPPGETWLYGLADPATEAAQASLGERAQAIVVPADTSGARVDLTAVLADLARRGVNELHLEAGGELNAAFITGGWVDEYLMYLAPCLIGPGRGLAELPALASLDQAVRLNLHEAVQVGPDLRLRLRPPGRADF
ncbi:bifunctional diaminohydroxyphosphoribosylaminopyrimidine deaminase/5-amino-6-(5-phosphoribosylamino)uracil reductase RibD [Aquabacterium fontiphilum]|uniref:bifunctional diaminohydroxyphosphoribosylaminopyrimidine deaminase/5-amino-6-(5-phosphoribosylamino)uracil reductase RibD n=1 Tax=Aquabacterium fontiphilum TaxID=450365 RepID=UPI0013788F70|nr:bifunctional diaminohydroxyphosphoribosylaminopyrimidine deaminase/5-amino-6-(5-phosphoribosylamino)uracil reductase RibD [Aquabacterium fontiphilum]NBD20604.1 bifunctional diaminohydroxyphosphoribosylaminopyrimidine deaminase/5-amino-6-(5-phosphoribosylamino)uracil reductase RibD [Aquabacterium fontiphilum]